MSPQRKVARRLLNLEIVYDWLIAKLHSVQREFEFGREILGESLVVFNLCAKVNGGIVCLKVRGLEATGLSSLTHPEQN